MATKLKLLFSSAIVAVTFSTPREIQGMDDISKLGEQTKPSGMQLSKGANDTLETVLGTGNNVLLKLSMDLSALKRPLEQGRLEKGRLEVPFRLFLTDFTSSPTAHPAVGLTTRIDCESTPLSSVLPNKPPSFDSYGQFTDWLKRGYFTNQVEVTYDFHVDVEKSAPTLAQQLFSVKPGGYRFIGTYEVNNDAIQPDQCVPQVTYASKRGNTNVTIATLGGTFYLNGRAYPVDNHYQSFPHPIIEQVIFKKDETKRFYSHKWIAKSEATAKVSYEQFPRHQVHNWPSAPVGTYSLLMQKPDDFEEIKHLACWDGTNGEEVNISDGRVFSIVCEAINKPMEQLQYLESIVKDDTGNLYTIRYQYPEAEGKERNKQKVEKLEQEIAEARKIEELEQREKQEIVAIHVAKTDEYINQYKLLSVKMTYEDLSKVLNTVSAMIHDTDRKLVEVDAVDSAGILPEFLYIANALNTMMNARDGTEPYPYRRIEQTNTYSIIWVIRLKYLIKEEVRKNMLLYKKTHGLPHPRWDEFSKM